MLVAVWEPVKNWRYVDIPSAELQEFVHFCHKDAIENILTDGFLLGHDALAEKGVNIRGNGYSWHDAEFFAADGIEVTGGNSSICCYCVSIMQKYPEWSCMPKGLLDDPQNYVGLWFIADPQKFTIESSEAYTFEPIGIADSLVLSVDEAFELMGTTYATAIHSGNR